MASSCNSPESAPVLTVEEFARIYRDSLTKRYTDMQFELHSDLGISAKKDSLEYKIYPDNAYLAYQAQPDAIGDILSEYADGFAKVHATEKKKIDETKIIPIIKPVDFKDEYPAFSEPYNEELIVVYAENSENQFRFLGEKDVQALSIPKDSLQAAAMKNLRDIIPGIKVEGGAGLYFVTAGGFYEANLLLHPTLWTKENIPVDGDFVIAIPNRDLLMITGSKDKKAILKMKEIVADAFPTGAYPVSEHLYILKGKKFVRYE